MNDDNMICVTGRNGSGKTTLLNIIAGVLAPDEGYVNLNSRDITRLPIEKRNVALVTPRTYIPHLDVDKHLLWGAKIKGLTVEAGFVQDVKKRLGIDYTGRLGKLSLGMKERVALGTALISRPEVILVDEAFSNIDNRGEFIKEFKDLSRSRSAVVFTTQFAEDARLADNVYILENGKTSKSV